MGFSKKLSAWTKWNIVLSFFHSVEVYVRLIVDSLFYRCNYRGCECILNSCHLCICTFNIARLTPEGGANYYWAQNTFLCTLLLFLTYLFLYMYWIFFYHLTRCVQSFIVKCLYTMSNEIFRYLITTFFCFKDTNPFWLERLTLGIFLIKTM